MKVVLAGTPNAGKTTLFNKLTGSNLRTGNFHGVTTAPAFKKKGELTFVDVPGMYAFSAYSMEERSAAGEINSADIIVNVLDATTLENNLSLTRSLQATGKKTVVFLTKLRALKRRGGRLDKAKLSAYLGARVYDDARVLNEDLRRRDFKSVGRIEMPLNAAYYGGNRSLSRADRLFYNPIFAIVFFIVAVTVMFFLAFHPSMPGAVLKDMTEKLICEKLASAVTENMRNEAVASLVGEGVMGGAGSVLSFLPQLAVLYLVLTLLDESGITSALSFTTDGLFEKANLSGRAAFSLVSGFGCTAAAILTTRGYSTPSAQKRTVAVLPFIPCGAKMPVFLTFLSPMFANPFPVITCFYFAGVALAIIASMLLKGGGEEMLSEVTPVSLPQLKAVAIKLCFYLKGFIIKVAGAVTAFCVFSWFLSHFSFGFRYVSADDSILATISRVILPLFYPMGVRDWRIAYAALCGFVAKENVAATIAFLMPSGTGLPLASTLGVCTFILLCPACVSAFTASCREVGWKFSLKCLIFQLLAAFAGGYLINLLFSL